MFGSVGILASMKNKADAGKLIFIAAHGFFNTIKENIDGAWSIVKAIGNFILHPVDTIEKASEIFQSLGEVLRQFFSTTDWDEIKSIATSLGDSTVDAITTEIENSACPARAFYLGGQLAGEFVTVGGLLKATKVDTGLADDVADGLIRIKK